MTRWITPTFGETIKVSWNLRLLHDLGVSEFHWLHDTKVDCTRAEDCGVLDWGGFGAACPSAGRRVAIATKSTQARHQNLRFGMACVSLLHPDLLNVTKLRLGCLHRTVL